MWWSAVLLRGSTSRSWTPQGRGTDDPLEAAGVALGRSLSEDADLILVVVPMNRAPDATTAAILDRTQSSARLCGLLDESIHADAPPFDHRISNLSGQGITPW